MVLLAIYTNAILVEFKKDTKQNNQLPLKKVKELTYFDFAFLLLLLRNFRQPTKEYIR
jgi:hypothetical protein